MPLLWPPLDSSQQNRGFLRREDYYTRSELATKKVRKPRFLLGEIYIHCKRTAPAKRPSACPSSLFTGDAALRNRSYALIDSQQIAMREFVLRK